MKQVSTEAAAISSRTPRFPVTARQPPRRLSRKLSRSSGGFAARPRFTAPVTITVRKKVQMSMTSSSLMSLTASNSPASSGEIR